MQPQIDLSQLTDEQLLTFVNSNPDLKSQYDKFMVQQKVINSINMKSKPLTDKEYLAVKDIKEYLDPEGGLLIEPTPHFAMKGFEQRTGEKVFINVLSHHVIDEPEQKQLVDFQNQEGIRVPMSVGAIKEDNDVKGEMCKVVDVVVNPKVAETLLQDINTKQFFVTLIQNYFFEKFKLKLKEEFTFPKLKYKGKSIQFQRVKGKKPPKIQVVKEETTQETDDTTTAEKKETQERMEHELFDQLNKLFLDLKIDHR